MSYKYFQDYVEERYGNLHLEDAAARYATHLLAQDFNSFSYPYGFFTAKLEGDAIIVNDLYTAPDYRKSGYAWKLFQDIKNIARVAEKNVIIGFSEFLGQGQEHGLEAMHAAGFKEAFQTRDARVFVRGVQ